MKAKKQNTCISVGDLVHYCPADMNEENHDIGMVFEIEETESEQNKKAKIFKIFWSRSKEYDGYPESGIHNRIHKQNVFKIIKQNEETKGTISSRRFVD